MEETGQSSRNSFLNSTDRNSCIPSEVRKEIDLRYNNSVVNKKYIFPRSKGCSQEIIKNDSCLLDKKITRLVITRQKTVSSVVTVNQSLMRLPDIKQKISLRFSSKNKNKAKNLTYSCQLIAKQKEFKTRVINLSKKRIELKIKQIQNKIY